MFSIENKEIQDHLLGEISESDNSVKALYEARKVESKLVSCPDLIFNYAIVVSKIVF